ncbi:uncharacterized protein EV420DRAFT_1746175 [Desarmillaria tabescens]|uniref:Uncharacterized protein n=1 Tax=Armillaria tabescens TaxID=1929756 RepID=A0AA39NA82_ARMTA|nr:uncharacterized protein EV420DRAFT_1746175 [Desarmillaria tabescens]KAK0461839.1 hypothetical protein EV420DRAFT_1746175 [Desarmillaria tabescens]
MTTRMFRNIEIFEGSESFTDGEKGSRMKGNTRSVDNEDIQLNETENFAFKRACTSTAMIHGFTNDGWNFLVEMEYATGRGAVYASRQRKDDGGNESIGLRGMDWPTLLSEDVISTLFGELGQHSHRQAIYVGGINDKMSDSRNTKDNVDATAHEEEFALRCRAVFVGHIDEPNGALHQYEKETKPIWNEHSTDNKGDRTHVHAADVFTTVRNRNETSEGESDINLEGGVHQNVLYLKYDSFEGTMVVWLNWLKPECGYATAYESASLILDGSAQHCWGVPGLLTRKPACKNWYYFGHVFGPEDLSLDRSSIQWSLETKNLRSDYWSLVWSLELVFWAKRPEEQRKEQRK